MSAATGDYPALLRDIKTRIRGGQVRAALAANRELLLLYWDVGRLIVARQQQEGWGSGVTPRLARDLQGELPGIKGFSERNLNRMIRFYREYPGLDEKVPQPVALLGDAEKTTQSSMLAGSGQGVPQPVATLRLRGAALEAALSLPWVGVSELTRALPKDLESALPSIDRIEAELSTEGSEGSK